MSDEPYAWASQPSPSPGGEHIVFVSDRENSFHYDLMLKEQRSGDTKPLGATRISRYNSCPDVRCRWSTYPVSRRNVYGRSVAQPIFGLWSLDTDGEREARQIADNRLFSDPFKLEGR